MRRKTRKRIGWRCTSQRQLVMESLERRNLLATVEVTSLLDVVDPDDNVMSLREAIVFANTRPGADEITFADALTNSAPGRILLTGSELSITDSLTLTGPGRSRLTIDANQLSRVMNVEGGSINVTLSGLTITGGRTTFNNQLISGVRESTHSGGGIRFIATGTLSIVDSALSGNSTTGDRAFGSAVFSNSGTVTLAGSTLTGNHTLGFGAFGGGIATLSGNVTLTNSTLSGNSTRGNFGFGGGIYTGSGNVTLNSSTLSDNRTADDAPGGGIYSQSGNVTLTSSTLSGNRTEDKVPGGIGGDGGGIYAVYGHVTLTNSTLSNNGTDGDNADGGGIFTRSGNITLASSTVSGNSTTGDAAHGGGIFTASGNVTLVNSTLSGNRTAGTGSEGGGLWVNNSLVTITSSTITGNAASRIGGGVRILTDTSDQKLTIHNSIIASNTDNGTAPDFIAPESPAIKLEVKSSLIGNNRGTTLTPAAAGANGNLIGTPTAPVSPRLGPLQNNGGSTQTHALLANSPAIDAGNGALLPVGTLTDQRGFARRQDLLEVSNGSGGDGTDIGAVEIVGVSITGVTADENAGPLHFLVTLSHAIPTGQSISVEFNTANVPDQAIAGTDYTAINNRIVTFTGGGPLTTTVAVEITNDALFENDETLTATLSNAVNAIITTASVRGTIRNDDAPPTVTLSVDNTVITEAGGVARFLATLSAESGLPVIINLAFSGTADVLDDYTRSGTQISIAPGQTSGLVSVTAIQDLIDEANETITVEITTAFGAIEALPQTATTEILNRTPLDFGDAPGRYPVTLLNDGAQHAINALVLGTAVDFEVDGQPSVQANGDGSDDDGVVETASRLKSAARATRSSFAVTASADGKLDAWIDFNQDGDWNDAGEQIFSSVSVTAGINVLAYTVPAGAQAGETFARFRLSSTGELEPTGAAVDGEVEDYAYTIVDGASTGAVTVEVVGGTVALTLDSTDQVFRSGSTELFRAFAGLVSSIQLNGTAGDDTILIDFASGLELPSGGVSIFGAGGANTLVLEGAGNFDFTDPNVLVTDVGSVELPSDELNRITVDAAAINRLSPSGRKITIAAGAEDQIEVVDVEDWRMTAPEIVDGRLMVTAQHKDPGGERIQLDTARPYRNFLQRGDVNNSGNVSASDALAIIFELNSPFYSNASGDLIDPASLSTLSIVYLDVNGDGRATSADALDVINILFQQTLGRGSGSGEELIPGRVQSDVIKVHQDEAPVLDEVAFSNQTFPVSRHVDSSSHRQWTFDTDALTDLQDIWSDRVDEILGNEDLFASLKELIDIATTNRLPVFQVQ